MALHNIPTHFRIARCSQWVRERLGARIEHESGLTSALTLTLSPRRGNSHRMLQVFRYQLCRIQRSALPEDGERFSLSPGERAGVRAGVPAYFATMTTVWARTAKLWNAVTCHRFPRLADLSAMQSRVQRLVKELERLLTVDGDKSPAKSAAKSAHSKAGDGTRRTLILWDQ
jgi:hypothetical protein